jgi:hypothetical protein
MHGVLGPLVAAFLIAPPAALRAEGSPSAAVLAFGQLSALVGSWESRPEDGPPHTVVYRLSGAGSVLVETWSLGPERESLTLYHLDGDRLLATHYCPQGNQPRLELVESGDGVLRFALRDGTNLQVAGRAHQHAFWMKLAGRDEFARSETYVENGAASESAVPGEAVRYRRQAPARP